LFGGSGLLSHFANLWREEHATNWHIIYNDFDDFNERLQYINTTNALIREIRQISDKKKSNIKINEDDYTAVRNLIISYFDKGAFVDVKTLQSLLLFSGRQINNYGEFIKEKHYYNRICTNDYDKQDYLSGVEVVKLDAFEMCEKYTQNETRPVFLFVDPPYFLTNQKNYNQTFDLKQNLELIQKIQKYSYALFSCQKSCTFDLLNFQNIANEDLRIFNKTNRINTFKGNVTNLNDILITNLGREND
jgi:hypothetical protein